MTRLVYAAVALLFPVAAASQTTYMIDVIQLLAGRYPERPFSLGDPWPSVWGATPAAREAGLRDGDRDAAIDGRPVRGLVDLSSSVRAHEPIQVFMQEADAFANGRRSTTI